MSVQHQLLTAVSFLQRAVLLQLYRSSQEDPEVRIAAYQQLIRCPNQDLFEAVKMTLKSETSSQGVIPQILHSFMLQIAEIRGIFFRISISHPFTK